jgi:hypothetical protein
MDMLNDTFPGRETIERAYPPGHFAGQPDSALEIAWLRQIAYLCRVDAEKTRQGAAQTIAQVSRECKEATLAAQAREEKAIKELRSHSFWGC